MFKAMNTGHLWIQGLVGNLLNRVKAAVLLMSVLSNGVISEEALTLIGNHFKRKFEVGTHEVIFFLIKP